MEPLSPREIQSRVRAGGIPEVIAAETGWPLDKVLRYAGPPLGEREHIVTTALTTELRRSGSPVSFADSVAAVVAPTGYSPDSITWDSYRREDGKWIITALLPAWKHGTKALWTYDYSGRNLHPLNDVARRLMGVEPEGDMDFITDTPIAVLVQEAEIEILDENRPRLMAVPALAVEEEDVVVVVAVDEMLEIFEDSNNTLMLPMPTQTPTASTKPVMKKPAKSKGRRASIPTWDEILFGTSKNDDV
ncbi:unannotated protein [freshwater metagenome]|uniref:Unannotated protein n=1 Tax=freshwater metagenome TaxID=449393 RepID=A0A6J7SK87_9ZZZZ